MSGIKEINKGTGDDVVIRAIDLSKILSDTFPVFELNVETSKFVMVSNPDIQYDDLSVYDDDNFIVVKVHKENEKVNKSKLVNDRSK